MAKSRQPWEFTPEELQSHELVVGRPYLFQEALGFLCGTVITVTPFKVKLGEDAVMIRNAESLDRLVNEGHASEIHRVPWVCLEGHAIRYAMPFTHPVPTRPSA